MAPSARLIWWPFRWRWLAKALLRIDFGPIGPDDYYFDLGTLALVQRATKVLRPGARVLDLGTGGHAVIGLALRRRLDARIIAADINPTLVRMAREAVARNGASIPVYESRFFSALDDDEFDVVLFNPPYVPGATASSLDLPLERRSQWDGGEDGLAVIRGFLTALAELTHPVHVLFTSNRWFVDVGRVQEQIKEVPELAYHGVWRHKLFPIDIHAVRGPTKQ